MILPDRILSEGVVLVEGESIADVRAGAISGVEADESVDLNGRWLAPGLIDIHIHGSNGTDLMAATADDLAALSRYLLSWGVTRYLPTTVPTDEAGFVRVIDLVSQYIREQPADGAQVMGIHFEGPLVNPNRCGALHVEHFRKFTSPEAAAIFLDPSLAERLPIRLMTLAPEIDGGLALVEALAQQGYVVAIGHSQASFEICEQAAAVGARHVTHFPNALAPLHHRQPGVFGWALLRRDITLDVIADGHHVDWRIIELIRRMKSPDHMALISDAIGPAGLGDGEYHVWGETIRVRDGRTQNASGAIAGSVISLWDAVRNLRQQDISLTEVINMASLIPARILGMDGMVGSIEKGKRADLVCFDEAGKIHFVVVNGRLGYQAE
jgi:N-acetylglucosamine-6-phosphate deacetylase